MTDEFSATEFDLRLMISNLNSTIDQLKAKRKTEELIRTQTIKELNQKNQILANNLRILTNKLYKPGEFVETSKETIECVVEASSQNFPVAGRESYIKHSLDALNNTFREPNRFLITKVEGTKVHMFDRIEHKEVSTDFMEHINFASIL